jgi:hypothetical protein
MITSFIGLTFVFLIIPLSSANLINIDNHSIIINEVNNNYQIRETILVDTNQITNESFYYFSTPLDAEELQVIIENTVIDDIIKQDAIYKINLSNINKSNEKVVIDAIYYMPLSTMYFNKMFLHNTSNVNLEFEGIGIFSNSLQLQDTSIKLKLAKTIVSETYNLYIMILVFLLVIIIIVTSWYAFFRRKNGSIRNRTFESTELLEIEKTLLMNILKEIEKLHRNQKLSDDSYHKLKNYYKNQTVDIMSVIESEKKTN